MQQKAWEHKKAKLWQNPSFCEKCNQKYSWHFLHQANDWRMTTQNKACLPNWLPLIARSSTLDFFQCWNSSMGEIQHWKIGTEKCCIRVCTCLAYTCHLLLNKWSSPHFLIILILIIIKQEQLMINKFTMLSHLCGRTPDVARKHSKSAFCGTCAGLRASPS